MSAVERIKKTTATVGRTDFVICGILLCNSLGPVSAADSFLAPISGLAENASRTVIETEIVQDFLQGMTMLNSLGS